MNQLEKKIKKKKKDNKNKNLEINQVIDNESTEIKLKLDETKHIENKVITTNKVEKQINHLEDKIQLNNLSKNVEVEQKNINEIETTNIENKISTTKHEI